MINTIGSAGKLPLLISVVFAVVLGVQGVKAHRTLAEKAAAQESVTESVQRWKQSYLALADTMKRWESSYRREDSIQDLVSLYSAVGLAEYGLRADIDNLILNKVEPVTQNDVAIGLTRICLASAGSGDGASLEVQAPNYQTLFTGLQQLSRRQDIVIGTIAVKGDKAAPVANLGDFCVLLRKS